MLRNTFLAVLTVLAVAACSQAAVMITTSSIDTPGLAGFQTWTVTATSDGAPLQGFDFVGDPTAPVDPATSRGFFGPMNQVNVPVSTVFTDSDALIPLLAPGANAQQDSNFLFNSTALLIIPGSARETANSLQAAFSTSGNFGQSVAVAELVIPVGAAATVNYRGVAGTTDGMEFPIMGTVGGGALPVPPVIQPINLGEVEQTTTIMANLNATGDPTISWSNLTPSVGNPALAATLTPQGAFSWNPAGSARGPKGNGRPYSWTATATNAAGMDTRVAISLSLIPEPATMSLVGLAMLGLVGLGFRKR
jgi:hypothetical protein